MLLRWARCPPRLAERRRGCRFKKTACKRLSDTHNRPVGFRMGSMPDSYYIDLIYISAFCLAGLVFALGPIVLANLLAARKTRQSAGKTGQFVECGMEPIGDAWIRYSAVYYLYALVFVAFAVDVLFLIPVALVYDREFVWRDLVEVQMFVGILSLVIVYAWRKGVFEWKRKEAVQKISPRS